MYKVYKKFDFACAHKLKGHIKCGYLHGHNYIVEVIINCETLTDDFGFVIDFNFFSELKKEYDHTGKIITISSEELAEKITNKILRRMEKDRRYFNKNDVSIVVKVWESDHSCAEYHFN